MKSIFSLILILFSSTLFAQVEFVQNTTWADTAWYPQDIIHWENGRREIIFAVNNDTLKIPAGKYRFIKIGDKVYKINYSLEEVKPAQTDTINYWKGGIISVPGSTFTPYSYDRGMSTPLAQPFKQQ